MIFKLRGGVREAFFELKWGSMAVDWRKVSWCWRTVRQPMISLFRLPGLADNAGTGRTSI
jgi:hypothetical protein